MWVGVDDLNERNVTAWWNAGKKRQVEEEKARMEAAVRGGGCGGASRKT